MEMKLNLQLVPQSAFCKNLRNKVGQSRWSSLSKQIRASNHFTCQLCGTKENRKIKLYTHLHEVWEYDDDKLIQKLAGFECLCPTCHAVHHWGLSQLRGMDMDMLVRHACKVNNCTKDEFMKHVYESFDLWRKRSIEINWELDMGVYEDLFK
jgi:hypothetical protein